MRLTEYGLHIQKVHKVDVHEEWYMVDLHNECVAWITNQKDEWFLNDAAWQKEKVVVSSPQDVDTIHRIITEWENEAQ